MANVTGGAAAAKSARFVRRVGILTHPRISEAGEIAAGLASRLAALAKCQTAPFHSTLNCGLPFTGFFWVK